MSGFVALVNLDGSPVDDRLLSRMTAYLAFRGPDHQRTQVLDGVGLGHALLRVGGHSEGGQPCSLDGRSWIVADARLDARSDLLDALENEQGRPCPKEASDVELIARAWAAWGEACALRLLGDFTFVVWDGPRRRLVGVRDHLGVRPLYYARAGSTVVASNTLDCVRMHPGVSSELDEFAIADFLLFGENREAGTTTFRGIRRLPPAHTCVWSIDETRMQRYWTLPVDEPLHLASQEDYVNRFNDLLRSAVADRMRTDRVTVLMSGGVDSPAIAAAAVAVRQNRPHVMVDAVTSVYERLIPDHERFFAGLVASHLDIPIRYDVRDDETSLVDWDRVDVRTPEPVANPASFEAGVQFLETTAHGSRVFLYGEGADNALRYEWRPYLSHLARGRRWGLLLGALTNDLMMHPRVPLWSSIRQIATARQTENRWREQFPEWLDESFSARCDCRDRWNARQQTPSPAHPVRPLGHASVDGVKWQSLFEDCDITGARGRVEFRYPFLDIRLLRYLQALPAMPWCRNKLIIRKAMRGSLPPAILTRKKTAVSTSADFQRVTAFGLPRPSASPELRRFVTPGRIPATVRNEQELRSALRPLGLGYWLQRRAAAGSKEFMYGTESAVTV